MVFPFGEVAGHRAGSHVTSGCGWRVWVSGDRECRGLGYGWAWGIGWWMDGSWASGSVKCWGWLSGVGLLLYMWD